MTVFCWRIDRHGRSDDVAILNGQDQHQDADLIPPCSPYLTGVNLCLARLAESLSKARVSQCTWPNLVSKIKKPLWYVRVTHGVLPYHSTK
ncbi:hypothetical protein Atai01_77050 [Amycolatopsis taiwanensis]|uniref:Uncharacterized protein n=1 Tax=Amycolatopsis taiwanensis TaxID=342230 RepID=A0A9W6R8F9_9PSEU|nr:hypothetical protein Atai01_77050 [Amycolatopsis taiwanensis]